MARPLVKGRRNPNAGDGGPPGLVRAAANDHFEVMDNAGLPRIEGFHIENYRALRKIDIGGLKPLTVLIGPNGSGKSTICDALAFLSDCFRIGLREAWQERGHAREIRTRGQNGPVIIGVTYRERPDAFLNLYVLEVTEQDGHPVISREELHAYNDPREEKLLLLSYHYGRGFILSDDSSTGKRVREEAPLRSPDLIAVNALGQLADHPRVAVLRDLLADWHISRLSIADTRTPPVAGPQARLSSTGANLANVIQYLCEQHPRRWREILRRLQERVPQLETISVEEMVNGRLAMQLKDLTFRDAIQARYASDGTMKVLACLVLLFDPEPPRLIALEEPENYVHPRLAQMLGEDCRVPCERSQVIVTTHSPYFLDAVHPEEVRVLYRDQQGFTQARRASDIPGIMDFMDEGALLGNLWMEGHFNLGDPLSHSGMAPRRPIA